MKTLFTILSFAFLNLTAQAGQEFDKFNADVAAYLTAQAVNPTEIIKYADTQGSIAREVLNPEHIQNVMAEALEDVNKANQLRSTLDSYKAVLTNYENAFRLQKGKYDSEYLDSFETLCRLIFGSVEQLKKLDVRDVKFERLLIVLEAVTKFTPPASISLSKKLEKNIQDGQFSASFIPVAEARLAKLRAEFSKL